MEEPKAIQETTTKNIIDFLIGISLFDKLQGDELKIVARRMNLIEIQKDEILFKEGEVGDYVCFVVEGMLDVIKQSATGDSILITTLSKGRSIGEMSVIDNFPRSATVKAQTEAKLLILRQKDFETIMEEYPKIGIKILKELSRLLSLHLRSTSSRLADQMFHLVE